MRFLSYLAVATITPTIVFGQTCTSQQRLAIAGAITTAFNEKSLTKSAELIDAFALTPDCPAIVSVDGAPGIEFGVDATTTKDFANVVRQAFVNVASNYTDYGNGTVLMDAIVTLGVLHYVQLPIYAHILVPIEFTDDCLISKLPAFVYVPVDVLGQPVSPPILPSIPGLSSLAGFENILVQLAAQGLQVGQLVQGLLGIL